MHGFILFEFLNMEINETGNAVSLFGDNTEYMLANDGGK